jgi:hypothetical protein
MPKFLLNLLVQISKHLVYSKIKFYLEKNFPHHFRPIQHFGPAVAHSLFLSTGQFSLPSPLGLGLPAGPAHHHGPTSRSLLPPTPKPNTAPPPAGIVPPPRSPRRLHRKRKTTTSNPLSFPPINRRHCPPLQSRKPARSTPPLKLLQAGNRRRSALPFLASAL